MQLAPLPVVIPLLVAAILAGAGNLLPRRVLDIVAILTSASIALVCLLLVHHSHDATIVYWFGGWKPASHSGFPVGVCFMIDPIGAGLAALVSLLVLCAFIFSAAYFESIKSLYHALMLVFLASMCGMCLTGDLFNLFVWFELMTATAVGLCGYKSEEKQSLQGALNFAIVNTIGAFLSLSGVALLYSLTGSLNMSQVGASLAASAAGESFIGAAFLFVVCGFLVKSAAAPFHFWLADAHAVAPTPVCILFSGVMVELGVYAIARVYWTVFAPSVAGSGHAVGDLFLFIGCLTALIGAILCFGQRHLKRLLAFSTISHVGLMLVGFALLRPIALAGVAIYVLGHGLAKGGLFACAGILLHRFGSVDEFDLRGEGRKVPWVGILMVFGALGLAGIPPFATFYGQALIDVSAEEHGTKWVCVITLIVEILTCAAVLRATARIFLGWGPVREGTSRGAPHIPMESETQGGKEGVPVAMWIAAIALISGAICVSLSGEFRHGIEIAAYRFQQSSGYTSAVLEGRSGPLPNAPFVASPASWTILVSMAGAILVALAALMPAWMGRPLAWKTGHGLHEAMRPLRRLQSGHVGDYTAWLTFGLALYGGLLLFLWHR